jgi:hypothetical protein
LKRFPIEINILFWLTAENNLQNNADVNLELHFINESRKLGTYYKLNSGKDLINMPILLTV